MKKKITKILAIFFVISTLFTISAFTVNAADVGHFDTSISAGNQWIASKSRQKTTSGQAVFNVKDYNDYTPGFVKDAKGNLKDVDWTIYCDDGMSYRMALRTWYNTPSGFRVTALMTVTSTNYDYYLYMGNPYLYILYVKGSYTPN